MKPNELFQNILRLGFIVVFAFSCAKETCPLDDVLQAANTCTNEPCPPKLPSSGPASLNTRHANAKTLILEQSFWNTYRSFLYLPDSPVLGKAPVLLYLHGYFDSSPNRYDAMLRYYARQGYIVIYPTFGNALYPRSWTDNAEESFRRALTYLDDQTTLQVDRENFAIVGHSIGGILAYRLANRLAKQDELPRPKLIVTSDAAGISTIAYPQVSIDDLSNIPASTKLLSLIAEETYTARFGEDERCENDSKSNIADGCNGFGANLRAMRRTPQIPKENKVALVIPSEKRGKVEIRSDHNAAQAKCRSESIPLNVVDSWGYWRYTHAALESVLKSNGDFKTLDGNQLRRDARWGDGQRLEPVLSLTDCLHEGACPKSR